MPTYRVMDSEGILLDKSRSEPDITEVEAVKLYRDMLTGLSSSTCESPRTCLMTFSFHNGFDHV